MILAACLSSGCAAGAIPPDGVPVTQQQASVGALRIFLTDQTTDGRFLKLRGKIINDYAEPIDGVRMIYLGLAAGDEPRILDHKLKIVEAQIAPGASEMFRWDIESIYMGGAGGRFQVLGFAIKRGATTLPLPPGWETGDDDVARHPD